MFDAESWSAWGVGPLVWTWDSPRNDGGLILWENGNGVNMEVANWGNGRVDQDGGPGGEVGWRMENFPSLTYSAPSFFRRLSIRTNSCAAIVRVGRNSRA